MRCNETGTTNKNDKTHHYTPKELCSHIYPGYFKRIQAYLILTLLSSPDLLLFLLPSVLLLLLLVLLPGQEIVEPGQVVLREHHVKQPAHQHQAQDLTHEHMATVKPRHRHVHRHS